MSSKESKDGKNAAAGSALARLGFSGWMLLTVGLSMLALHLCRNQGKMERLSQWDFYLRGAGRVVLFSGGGALGETRAQGAGIMSWDKFPELGKLGAGRDAAAFEKGLGAAGSRIIIVGGDLADGERVPRGSILYRLALFEAVDGFHPLMIKPEGAIYEIAWPPGVSQEKLQALVKLARAELLGAGPKTAGDAQGEGIADPAMKVFEVAIQIQGLRPAVINKKNIHQIRRDLFASGKGGDLESATLDAARKLKAAYGRKLEVEVGDLKEALAGCVLELHVLYDFTLVAHEQGDMDSGTYQAYLDSVFEPGIHGIYVNRAVVDEAAYLSSPKSRLRLPSDAVYWMRTSGSKIVERIAKDMAMGGLKELGGSAKITLDRFRTIHAAEEEPGGRVVVCTRGVPLVPGAEVSKDNARLWGVKAARWLAGSLGGDGMFRINYLPDRDFEKVEKPEDITFVASRYIHAAMAFLDAGGPPQGDDYQADFDRALPAILSWLKVCPGAAAAKQLPTAMKPQQVMPLCGPMRRDGTPAAAELWGQGGVDQKKVPGGLVFMFANTRAGTEESAFAGLMIARYILQAEGKARKEREKVYLPLLKGIVEFVLFMQRQDGSLQCYFVDDKNAFYKGDDPLGGFASIMLLAEAGRLMKDPRIAAALKPGMDYHAGLLEKKIASLKEPRPRGASEEKELLTQLGWGLAALASASLRLEDEGAGARAAGLAVRAAGELQLGGAGRPAFEPDLAGGFAAAQDQLPDYRSILLTLGMIWSWQAARRWGLKSEEEALSFASRQGLRFAAQLQLRSPGSTLFAPNEQRTDGGVRQSPLNATQRIDMAGYFIAACKKFIEMETL